MSSQFLSQEETDALLKGYPLAVGNHGPSWKYLRELELQKMQQMLTELEKDSEYPKLIRGIRDLAEKYGLNPGEVTSYILSDIRTLETLLKKGKT